MERDYFRHKYLDIIQRLAHYAQRMDAVWKSTLFGWVPIAAALLALGWWYLYVPSPGKAVAALAVAAAVMSLRPEAKGLERSVWMLVLCGFLSLELRAIDKDRVEQNDAHAQEMERSRQSLQKIKDAIDTSIANAKLDFAKTMKSMGQLVGISKEAVNEITGGDSFAFVRPIDFGFGTQLAIYIHGTHIVRDVMYQVNEGRPPYPIYASELLQPTHHRIGDVTPDRFVPIDDQFRRIDPVTGAFFTINIASLNGQFVERLEVHVDKEGHHPTFCLTVVKRDLGPPPHRGDKTVLTEGCPPGTVPH